MSIATSNNGVHFKVITIHMHSPAGGILVFLTGQREVKTLCSWLSKAFPVTKIPGETLDKLNSAAIDDTPTRMSGAKRRKLAKASEAKQKETAKLRGQINIEDTEDEPLPEDREEEEESVLISRFKLDKYGSRLCHSFWAKWFH